MRPLYAPRQNSPGVQTALAAPARLAAIATQSRSAAERVAAIVEAIGCAQLCPYLRGCGGSSRSCEWIAQTAAGSAQNRQLGCDGPATSVRSGPCSSPLTWAAACLEDGKEWRGGGWPRFEREGQGGGCPWWAGSVWSESDLLSVRSCTGLIMQALERIALVPTSPVWQAAWSARQHKPATVEVQPQTFPAVAAQAASTGPGPADAAFAAAPAMLPLSHCATLRNGGTHVHRWHRIWPRACAVMHLQRWAVWRVWCAAVDGGWVETVGRYTPLQQP